MDEIRPDNGFDSAERGVNGGENNDRDGRSDIDEKRFPLVRLRATDHFVSQSERDGGEIQTRTRGKQPRDHENGRGGILRRHTETDCQILVDGVNLVIVVRLNENVADKNARDDGAESELKISVVA